MNRSRRWTLLNPGPVNATEAVRKSLLGPDICHRETEFSVLLKDIRRKLLGLFGLARTHTAAVLTGSGTLAVESMLSSYETGTGRLLILSNGVYGDRLADIARAHRIPHRVLRSPLGEFPDLLAVRALLERDKSFRAVALVHHETSTGMLNPLRDAARLAHAFGKTVLVDAVSSLGAEDIDWKYIDFAAGSAGKCLHGFPGVSFVLARKKCLGSLTRDRRSVYADLRTLLEAEDRLVPAFTPAVQLFYAFDKALDELKKEGLRRRIRRYADKSRFVQTGLQKLGVRLLVRRERRSHVLTAAWLPSGMSYERLHARLKKAGFVVYAGQSSLAGRIFRVSNLGEVSKADLRRFLNIFARTLRRTRSRMPAAIVLAAGVGRRFGRRTRLLPKCLIPIDGTGRTLLDRYLDAFEQTGVRDIALVVGHAEAKIRRAVRGRHPDLHIRFIRNAEYRQGSVLSLHKAGAFLDRDVLIMDADVFFPVESLARLLDERGSAFLIDPGSRSAGEEMMLMAKNGRPFSISKKTDPALKVLGEATGIVKLQKNDAAELGRILWDFRNRNHIHVEYEDALSVLLKKRIVGWTSVDGSFWSEMDFESDLKKISRHLAGSTD